MWFKNIPFLSDYLNDATTFSDENPETYMIGSKTEDGIDFSVIKVLKNDRQPENLEETMVEYGGRITELINKERHKGYESIFYKVFDTERKTYIKTVKVSDGMIALYLEFPVEYEEEVSGHIDPFFSSLEIIE